MREVPGSIPTTGQIFPRSHSRPVVSLLLNFENVLILEKKYYAYGMKKEVGALTLAYCLFEEGHIVQKYLFTAID